LKGSKFAGTNEKANDFLKSVKKTFYLQLNSGSPFLILIYQNFKP